MLGDLSIVRYNIIHHNKVPSGSRCIDKDHFNDNPIHKI